MQASDFDHRCTEPTCCVYGQPTTTSCLCHKSREDMMLAALVAEKRAREEAEAAVAFIADEGTYADSYGVPGSDFGVCRFCEAGGAPGIPFEHNKTCPILRCEEVSAEWLSGRLEARVRRLWGCHPSRRRCDKCNAVLAEARSPLAPKEDTNA